MINWFSSRQGLDKKEKELDEHLKRVEKRVLDMGEEVSIPIDIDFPKEFERQCGRISTGPIDWREFYVDEPLGIYSLQCRIAKGTILREHKHPGFDEYIYVVHGKLVNFSRRNPRGDILVPPERPIVRKGANVRGWHRVPENNFHQIQALEDNTQFVCKFIATETT